AISSQAIIDRHGLDEAAATEKVSDDHAKSKQARRIESESQWQKHRRTQERAQQDLKIQGLRRVIEIEDERPDKEHERTLKRIDAWAKIPLDHILQIAIIENPQLLPAFEASMMANGREEQLRMQEKFQGELAKAYSLNSDQFQNILQTAIRYIAEYMIERE